MTESRLAVHTCGWDIGGAHLKFAALSADKTLLAAEQLCCPLWQDLAHLEQAIGVLNNKYDLASARHAVTMTGELCDNFKNREEGVRAIVQTLNRELPSQNYRLYSHAGGWIDPHHCVPNTSLIASANWNASAQLVSRHLDTAIVVDIGSTTTDVICVKDGSVQTRGHDDFNRLKNAELVYTGLVRTPVAAIVSDLPFDDENIPVVAETFATTADVYRILDCLHEDADLYPSADGGPKTREGSARRLFRMIGRDYSGESDQACRMAERVRTTQLERIGMAINKHVHARYPSTVDLNLVGMGCGEALVGLLAEEFGLVYRSFASLLQISERAEINDRLLKANVCGPAVAVAFELAGME